MEASTASNHDEHGHEPGPSPPDEQQWDSTARAARHPSSSSSSRTSRITPEKNTTNAARAASSAKGGDGHLNRADPNARLEMETESYSSCSNCGSDDDAKDDENGSGGESGRGAKSSSSGFLPPVREDFLQFLSYTLRSNGALRDHRLMTIEAFRQVLLVGTNQGVVAVVDPPTGRVIEVYEHHKEPICDVDCNVNEMYIAACDKAGNISIQNRRDVKDVWTGELKVPMQSVALHPLYHKMESCPVVCGGATKVLLLTKGVLWSSSRRVTTLQEGRGRIHKVRWCHTASIDIVAWLSDVELVLYDVKKETHLRRLPLPDPSPYNALYPPTLLWERSGARDASINPYAKAVLLCGWGDVIQELHVFSGTRGCGTSGGVGTSGLPPDAAAQGRPHLPWRSTSSPSPSPSMTGSPSAAPSLTPLGTVVTAIGAGKHALYTIELRTPQPLRPSSTPFPYRVCGIAPYGSSQYVVLAGIVESGAEGVMTDLEVRVVHRDTGSDAFRGRMPIGFIHPLQLYLTHLDAPPVLPEQQGERMALSSSSPLVASPSAPADNSGADDDARMPSPLAQYFILSVDTIVRAMPPDFDDRVTFLQRSGRYEQAFRCAVAHAVQLQRHTVEGVGQQWLLNLFHRRDTDATALLRIVELLPEVIPREHCDAWEQWIYRLDTCGESWRLVAILPGRTDASAARWADTPSGAGSEKSLGGAEDAVITPNTDITGQEPAAAVAAPPLPSIRREYYDLVLLRCLRHDPNLFFAALRRLDMLFSVPVVFAAAEAAYREHCVAIPWWVDEDGEDERKGNEGEGATAPSLSLSASVQSAKPPREQPGVSPEAVRAKGEAAAPTDGSASPIEVGNVATTAPPTSMSRTERWSLTASYAFLLRCAGRYEEALQVLLRLPSSPRSDREVFRLIRDQQLFRAAMEALPELLQRRESATLELLSEHIAPDGPCLSAAGGAATLENNATPSLPETSSSSASVPSLSVTQYGSVLDPLHTEAVIGRLVHTDRLHLLLYLKMVHAMHPKVFVQVAKRHAQLLATLYMDYDRASLLPFLKQMSMYVERIRELHALCRKHHLLEEEVFLLFRMGREDEALHVLVERMYDLRRALEYIATVSDRDEQAGLFAKLVDYIVAFNMSLPMDGTPDGPYTRYIIHKTAPCDTFVTIAQHYHVALPELLLANGVALMVEGEAAASGTATTAGVGGREGERSNDGSPNVAPHDSRLPTPPSPCVVPLNLFGQLLEALAEPQLREHPAFDVRLVLRKLPSGEPIPDAGPKVAAIARCMTEEVAWLSTVSEVSERDLMGYYGQLLKRRTAAIVMGRHHDAGEGKQTDPGATSVAAAVERAGGPLATVHRCSACRQRITLQVVVFACQHMYHPACVLQYTLKSPSVATDAAASNADAISGVKEVLFPSTSELAGGSTAAVSEEQQLRRLRVYCRACRQNTGDVS